MITTAKKLLSPVAVVISKGVGAAIFFIPLAVSLWSIDTALYLAAAVMLLSLIPYLKVLAFVVLAIGWGVIWWQYLQAFLVALLKPHSIIGYIGTGLIGVIFLGVLLLVMLVSIFLLACDIALAGQIEAGRLNDKKQEPTQPPEAEQLSPYRVLELNEDASEGEIRARYLAMMQQYHPDKVEHLGPELKELANIKTVQIKQAYEMLIDKSS